MRILRCPKVLDKTGYTRAPLYDKVTKGLFTRPIKLGGARSSGWPEHEVDAIIAAHIRGATDSEIKKLVERLHEQRKTITADLVGA